MEEETDTREESMRYSILTWEQINSYLSQGKNVYLCMLQTVRDAIHAGAFANETQTLAGFFRMCTSRLNYTTIVNNTLPYHTDNIARGKAFAALSSTA